MSEDPTAIALDGAVIVLPDNIINRIVDAVYNRLTTKYEEESAIYNGKLAKLQEHVEKLASDLEDLESRVDDEPNSDKMLTSDNFDPSDYDLITSDSFSPADYDLVTEDGDVISDIKVDIAKLSSDLDTVNMIFSDMAHAITKEKIRESV